MDHGFHFCLNYLRVILKIEMPPTVSIIVPCLNEEKRIRVLLDALLTQTYPIGLMDVTIADGGSLDQTREVVAAFQIEHPELRLNVIDNLAGSIPAALNEAIKASNGVVILRMDAHSAPYPDYVERSLAALESGKGANVGGIWEIRPGSNTWIARSIAAAAAHRLGVGDALYRHTQVAAAVDTVPFGCFRRELLNQVVGYDETLLANEDYEFNARIRLSGHTIWLDPAIRSIYFSRASFDTLAQQYFRYGFWKLNMLRRYPGTLRWRQALPPVFVVSLVVGCILGFFWQEFFLLVIIELLVYFSVLGLAGLKLAITRKEYFLAIGLPLAILVMHIAWGSGFLSSVLIGKRKSK